METPVSNGIYRSIWNDCHVNFYSGPRPQMTEFHMHDFYEIHLVLSGEIDVLFTDNKPNKCNAPLLILNQPLTPHFLTSDVNSGYTRYCLTFSEEFIGNYLPEWNRIKIIFGTSGNIIHITPEQAELFTFLTETIQNETSPFRQRLLVYYMLSRISGIFESDDDILSAPPGFILDAISYIDEHFSEKILASDLAWKLNIGRTTLMTAFKKYTGNTLNNYIIQCRLNHAIRLLSNGITEQEVAELCGFVGIYGLIRTFKRVYNMTPRQFIATNPLQSQCQKTPLD